MDPSAFVQHGIIILIKAAKHATNLILFIICILVNEIEIYKRSISILYHYKLNY
jgi:hypothetical protein